MRLGTCYRYFFIHKLNLPLSGNKVLDIGCYDGFLLSCINAQEKVGIDLHVLKKHPNIQYIERDFLNYDFGNNKFDKIFAFDVLEHVKEDKEFLEKIIQLLSPNGTAILTTPNKNIKIFPSFLQDWVDKKWGHNYRRGYTPQKIKELLIDTNNKDSMSLNIIYWNCPFFRFFYLLLSLLWRMSSSQTLIRFIAELDSKFKQGENGFLIIIIKKSGSKI